MPSATRILVLFQILLMKDFSVPAPTAMMDMVEAGGKDESRSTEGIDVDALERELNTLNAEEKVRRC